MNSDDRLAVIRGGFLGGGVLQEALRRANPSWERPDRPSSPVRYVEAMQRVERAWRRSEEFVVIDIDFNAPEPAPGLSVDALVETVRNMQLPIEDRANALRELLLGEYPEIADLVVSELERATSVSWERVLVAALEDVQVSEPDLRARLMASLFGCATKLILARDSVSEATLASALRRYSAMVPESEVESFQRFLEASVPPRTKSLASVCIENVFSAGPPTRLYSERLRDRLLELVRTYANPELASSAESGAILINAMGALSSLSPESVGEVVEPLRSLAGRPVLRLVIDRLRKIRLRWTHAAENRVALAFLDEGLATLMRS